MCKEPVLPEELQRSSSRRGSGHTTFSSRLGARARRRGGGSGGRIGRRPSPPPDAGAATPPAAAAVSPSEARSEYPTDASRHDNNVLSGSRLVSDVENDLDSISVLPSPPPRIVTPDRASRYSDTPSAVTPDGAGVGSADIESSSLQQDVSLMVLEQGCVSRTSSSGDEAENALDAVDAVVAMVNNGRQDAMLSESSDIESMIQDTQHGDGASDNARDITGDTTDRIIQDHSENL